MSKPALLVAACALAAGIFTAAPLTAAAHPLGNFSVNRYARLEVAGDQLRIRYIVDMAEIPTFQELAALGVTHGDLPPAAARAYGDRKAAELGRGLRLRLDGAPAALRMVDSNLSFPPGQGGLRTLRLVTDYAVALPGRDTPVRGEFRDTNFAGRLGWKETVVRALDGARLEQSSVPAADQTDELRTYPQDALSTPLDRSSAQFRFRPGIVPAAAASNGRQAPAPRATDRLAGLLATDRPTAWFFAFALLAALLLGALHALSPGHGKAVMAAYLVGTNARPRHALLLGLAITATHTAGVLLLGVVTLVASQYVLPERLYPWLSLLSGLTVLLVGGGIVLGRLQRLHHGHAHTHAQVPSLGSWRRTLALGVSGGLLPCPSALVVLLSGVALNRVALGLLIVIAFSAGVGFILVAIGLALARGGALLSRALRWGRLAGALPVASALVVTGIGVVVSAQALGQVVR